MYSDLARCSRFSEMLADDFICSLADGSYLDREAFLKHVAAPAEISNLLKCTGFIGERLV
jgi:hypothetical protein